MDTKQRTLQTKIRIFDPRIWRLNLEERIARHRCDWSVARSSRSGERFARLRNPIRKVRHTHTKPVREH